MLLRLKTLFAAFMALGCVYTVFVMPGWDTRFFMAATAFFMAYIVRRNLTTRPWTEFELERVKVASGTEATLNFHKSVLQDGEILHLRAIKTDWRLSWREPDTGRPDVTVRIYRDGTLWREVPIAFYSSRNAAGHRDRREMDTYIPFGSLHRGQTQDISLEISSPHHDIELRVFSGRSLVARYLSR